MKTVSATFKLTFTPDQYEHAVRYVEDMKKHPRRVYWHRNQGKSDEELIYSYIAHRILSGFYTRYSPATSAQILEMNSAKLN